MQVSDPFDDFCQGLALLLEISRSRGLEDFLDEIVEAVDPSEAPLLDGLHDSQNFGERYFAYPILLVALAI